VATKADADISLALVVAWGIVIGAKLYDLW